MDNRNCASSYSEYYDRIDEHSRKMFPYGQPENKMPNLFEIFKATQERDEFVHSCGLAS
jgi:hypothetical protein